MKMTVFGDVALCRLHGAASQETHSFLGLTPFIRIEFYLFNKVCPKLYINPFNSKKKKGQEGYQKSISKDKAFEERREPLYIWERGREHFVRRYTGKALWSF
jgi:hypothetical protein